MTHPIDKKTLNGDGSFLLEISISQLRFQIQPFIFTFPTNQLNLFVAV
jgi:hypothetical protein